MGAIFFLFARSGERRAFLCCYGQIARCTGRAVARDPSTRDTSVRRPSAAHDDNQIRRGFTRVNDNAGKLILRLALGISLLLHGIAKLTGGIGFITATVTGAGLPAALAYGVYIGEVVAPLMVIAGWYSRIGAAIIAVNMLFAIGLVHSSELFTLSKTGGWALELQGLILFSAIAIALIGPGKFAVNSK
jgi:putative oxidoreductase